MASRSIRGVAAAFVISPLVVAACSSAPTRGVIAGTAAPCGGPGPVKRPPVLTIKVVDSVGKTVGSRTVASPYHFRFAVKSGTYVVSTSGDSPETVQVQSGRTSSVQLTNACV
jgi:hypothetical protein